ncbi:MAG: acetoacetate metabolism regulatory protein AtoC [Candidatus Methanofastidiosum methylothiophilum]|uniref:Acetoacetate metabolism regulatory protein AtoC n=1 Tax=Candidatus Methanofastidiosum methylothiophilum TaxID=1705564 RepID=A0A150IKT9_9EURY|nr:MAG: acetoacetate metabolism regulatory protein AtoC [Candidatus Methanofastidiosum methylthiophilus]KYC47732.1 MAG: acetoacetate metabolism regulatory protein AtoC [Candidatus Methanofastidiosum methylthiophilus]KYC50503.1 MAG: acetoacetate metabolism regulatory protein AtoC [Candidatus Methanofastidiosum methylthiophilus]
MSKILIVEDYKDLSEFYQELLEEDTLFTASDGEAAVSLYKEHKPDMVLMDLQLPKKSGIEATKEILIIDPKAKIIAITAYGSTIGSKALEAGVKEVLRKPIRFNELKEIIEKYKTI